VTTTVALFAFGDAVRDAVHGLKYDDLRALAPLMGRLMASEPRVAALEFDAVVPVPLHPRKARRRGYNQAELLAGEIASALAVPLSVSCLRRVVDTPALARTTSRVEREAGVRDAFVGGPHARGRRLLLVDDVTTTGSTLRECASALLAAGAAEVNAVVFAKEI
jgi:ComF family protein